MSALTTPAPMPAQAVAVHRFGREREPVVVVDGATGDWRSLVDYAATRSRFVPAATVDSHYPGLLGPAPTRYVQTLVERVLSLARTHFDAGDVAPARARGNFSLVTMAPAQLSPDQRAPHVDAADRMQFAAVHFLSDNRDGTGFFRHRATGYETIDGDRLPLYRPVLDRELAALPSGSGYETGPGDRFEMIGKVDAVPDRLIVYRAALLHSGLISGIPEGAADPRRGRLTGNLFLQCRRAS